MFPTIKESLYRNKGISNLNQAKKRRQSDFFLYNCKWQMEFFPFSQNIKKASCKLKNLNVKHSASIKPTKENEEYIN